MFKRIAFIIALGLAAVASPCTSRADRLSDLESDTHSLRMELDAAKARQFDAEMQSKWRGLAQCEAIRDPDEALHCLNLLPP
jgi:hypothetical protein